jgi:imidazolonepropionase
MKNTSSPDSSTGTTRTSVWRNARLATFDPVLRGIGQIVNAAIAVDDDRISFAGPEKELPAQLRSDAVEFDCEQRWITPGLVDCHTHVVYAGHRAAEFEQRLAGTTYEQIARAGGGILSSVRALREASEATLVSQTLPRLDALIAEGVTTVEIKSGYGLDLENELKSLRVARRLATLRDISIMTTFLGLHALPPTWAGDREKYLRLVIDEILPAIVKERVADAADAFCENIAFSPDQIRRFFEAAKRVGLPVKLHADQLANSHAAALATEFGALSADHLEHTDEAGAIAMARAGTVAALHPGAFYFLRDTTRPPIELFRRHGVPMAVATDCNPGTSPLTSILLAMNMAATLFGMTVDECLAGVTREAARALGMQAQIGTLEPGKLADFAIWDIDQPAELVYRIGFNPLHARVRRGVSSS